MVLARMSGRGHFVGSSPANAPLITRYLLELLDILEPHFAGGRRYLFGGRPSFGDFGLAAQLYEAYVDPTAGGLIKARGPAVMDWCLRMIDPRNDGPFETWGTLEATLRPLLAYVGDYFLPWSDANTRALQMGASDFSVELPGGPYVQPPQKYHAKSLAALKARRARVSDPALGKILADTGCAEWLEAG